MTSREDAERIAKKLGADVRPGRKHDLAVVRHGGRYITQYGIRRGSRDLPHPHIHRQLHISPRQTRDLADCPMSADQYFQTLARKGLLNDA